MIVGAIGVYYFLTIKDHPMAFYGFFGMFLALFMLFLRFLPCINIAEVKWTKRESDPHFDDIKDHPDRCGVPA